MLFQDTKTYTPQQPTAVTIGNFDGVHLGHQQLLSKTIDYAKKNAGRPVALTFSPRPEAWFRKDAQEVLLFSESQKHRALTEFGIKDHIVQPFNEGFSQTSHSDFITHHLKNRLKAAAVIVGDDFRFGAKRLGDTLSLIHI